jgi:hypothetical protein
LLPQLVHRQHNSFHEWSRLRVVRSKCAKKVDESLSVASYADLHTVSAKQPLHLVAGSFERVS